MDQGFTISKYLYLFYTSLIAVFCIKYTKLILEIFKTEPINIHKSTFPQKQGGDSQLLLLHAISLEEENLQLLRYHAFIELETISQHNLLIRRRIFLDNTGQAWLQVVNNCINIIETISYQIQHIYESQYGTNESILSLSKYEFLNKLNRNNIQEKLYNDFQIQMCAIRAVSNFIAAAKKEDENGIIQSCDSIPTVLNSLIKCLTSLNHLKKFIQSQITSRPDYGIPVPRRTSALISVVEEAIYQIVITFYDKLSYYSFSPKCAEIIQRFANFQI